MINPIKFRIRLDCGEMKFFQLDNNNFHLFKSADDYISKPVEILLGFDKNGREVYEDDVVILQKDIPPLQKGQQITVFDPDRIGTFLSDWQLEMVLQNAVLKEAG